MKKVVKINGELTNDFNDEMLKKTTLCNTCGNCYASKCEKVSHIFDTKEELENTPYIPKQQLDKYPFITDGYTLVDNNGDIEEMYVFGCNNYQYVDKNAIPKIDIKAFNIAREALFDFYTAYQCKGESNIKKRKLGTKGRGNPGNPRLQQ